MDCVNTVTFNSMASKWTNGVFYFLQFVILFVWVPFSGLCCRSVAVPTHTKHMKLILSDYPVQLHTGTNAQNAINKLLTFRKMMYDRNGRIIWTSWSGVWRQLENTQSFFFFSWMNACICIFHFLSLNLQLLLIRSRTAKNINKMYINCVRFCSQ